jgi:hypothetical protein
MKIRLLTLVKKQYFFKIIFSLSFLLLIFNINGKYYIIWKIGFLYVEGEK